MDFQVVGPAAPDMLYRTAVERRRREQLERRAQSDQACPDCGSAGYDAAFGYCDRWGYSRAQSQLSHNGHPVLQRSHKTGAAPIEHSAAMGAILSVR